MIREREEWSLPAKAVYDKAQRFLTELEDAKGMLRVGWRSQGAERR